MEEKSRVYAAVLPTILLIPVTAAVLLLKTLVFKDAEWYGSVAVINAVLIALNPGMLLWLVPLWFSLSKLTGEYVVSGVTLAEGVKPETLHRCAAIAEAEASHPIGACLRAYCGDVGFPPDKCVEMPGLGVSAQFSGQMIHVGSAEYLRGLGVEVPDSDGITAHVALAGRALGTYRFRRQAEIAEMRTITFRGMLVSGAFKLLIWVLLLVAGSDSIAYAAAGEAVSFALALVCVRRLTK